MSRQIRVRLFTLLVLTFISCFLLALTAFKPVLAGVEGITYSGHVANIGWQDYVSNGSTAGTEGKKLQLEAYKVKLVNPSNVGVEYRAHVQNIGWQDYVSDDAVAGTVGRALQIEAVSLRLNGPESANYNIFYRVHVQDYGWLGWAKNDENAGTTGQSKRVEALQIQIIPVTEAGPNQDQPAFVDAPEPTQPDKPDQSTPLHYRAYVAAVGWNPGFVPNGTETGSGDIRGVEAVQIGLSDELYQKGGIEFRTCGGSGWTPWLSNDNVAGGPGDPIQAVRIRLTGKLPFQYDICYRVHVPNRGWTNWGRNGSAAGSEGFGRGISLIQILLTSKGNVPGPFTNAFEQPKWYWPLNGITGISSNFGPRSGKHHDGIDIPAAEGTPIRSAKAGVVKIAGPNGNFGNCVAIEHDSGENCYYAHMVRVGCKVGDRVARGQVIGFIGTTGNSLGNHLHFEVYDTTGELVTPLKYY